VRDDCCQSPFRARVRALLREPDGAHREPVSQVPCRRESGQKWLRPKRRWTTRLAARQPLIRVGLLQLGLLVGLDLVLVALLLIVFPLVVFSSFFFSSLFFSGCRLCPFPCPCHGRGAWARHRPASCRSRSSSRRTAFPPSGPARLAVLVGLAGLAHVGGARLAIGITGTDTNDLGGRKVEIVPAFAHRGTTPSQAASSQPNAADFDSAGLSLARAQCSSRIALLSSSIMSPRAHR
jgi:hypothetical protein